MAKESIAFANGALSGRAAVAGNACLLRGYSGAQPATAAGPLTGTLLFELVTGSPTFGVPANRAIAANPIASGVGLALGQVGYVALLSSDGLSTHALLSAGLQGSGQEVIFDTLECDVDKPVVCLGMSLTQPDGS